MLRTKAERTTFAWCVGWGLYISLLATMFTWQMGFFAVVGSWVAITGGISLVVYGLMLLYRQTVTWINRGEDQ